MENIADNYSKNSEDLWNPYRELLKVVNKYVYDKCATTTSLSSEFENLLRRHKQNFLSLLQNPPKNPKTREELKKGMVEGITVKGIGHQILSKELYNETIIMSDMFELNEFVALDLLCTAQIQMTYYTGLPRGLVAILLYYDGRKSIVSALRTLVQARNGIQWTLDVKPDVQSFVTNYTNQLMENGLFDRIFELLRTLELSKEIDKLQENLALGGPKHRRMVIDLFICIKQTLAEIVFLWAAQSGIPSDVMSRLIAILREQKNENDASGKIDNVTFYLEMGFLAAIDLSVLHVRENGDQVVRTLPILSEATYLENMITELSPNRGSWACEGLQAISMFGFSVTLSLLRLLPQTQNFYYAIEYENDFIDAAVDMKVFEFLHQIFFETDLLFEDEFLLKRMHNLITDFVVLMYSKVKEMRIKADETARTVQVYLNEGLEPPENLPKNFENFLLSISKLYAKDPLNLELMIDYWCPLEINPTLSYSYRAPPRSVSLFKFLRLAGDMVPSNLFVPYLKMLTSLSNCRQAARHCFNMLKQSGQQTYNNTLSWDHFFQSFNQYYKNLRQEALPSYATTNDTIYRSRIVYHKGITPKEIDGLYAVLDLIKTIGERDEFSRLALCEHPGWAPLTTFLGLVACSVPLTLKANMLNALASLCKSHELASQMWNYLEASQILITIPTTSSYQPRGIQSELEEVESRKEVYPLTRAVLEFLEVLVDSGIPRTLGAGPRKPGFDPYLTFVINSVFLKFNTRCYKDESEKWMVACACLQLIEKFLNHYEPQVSDFSKENEFNSPPGFHIMLQMSSKTEFFNLILYIIDQSCLLLEQYVNFVGKDDLAKASLLSLKIIERVLTLQNKFIEIVTNISYPLLLSHLSKLLMTINPRTNKPDYCISLVKYVSLIGPFPQHSFVSAKIMFNLTSSPLTHSQIINTFMSHEKRDTIRDAFVECLDYVEGDSRNNEQQIVSDSKEIVLKMMKQCLTYSSPNLSHFLLGFDLKKDIALFLFQFPGVLNFPRTCIHSLLSILHSAIANADGAQIRPTLSESAYHFLYLLCSNHKTYNPVLRFLRLNQKFFKEHLTSCAKRANEGVVQLNQLAWLLKIVAVELKITCSTKQVFYLKELLKLLLGISEDDDLLIGDSLKTIRKSDYNNKMEEIGTTSGGANESIYNNNSISSCSSRSSNSKKNILIDLLMQFDFRIERVASPKWEYFDNDALDKVINVCRTETLPKLIDLKKLHRLLINEIATVQQGTTAASQKNAIFNEVENILMHALNLNNARNVASSMIAFVDAWRQVLQVFCIYVPDDILSLSQRQLLCINLMEKILNKIVNEELLMEIAFYLSGAIVILIEHVRRCTIKEKRLKDLDRKRTDPQRLLQPKILKSNVVSLQNILEKLLEWIVNSDVTWQKLRINLYGCLITFLHLMNVSDGSGGDDGDASGGDITTNGTNNTNKEDDLMGTFVNRLDASIISLEDKQMRKTIPINLLNMFGDKLIEIMCQDCIGGHDVCKMLAMTCLGVLLTLTGNIDWIVHISSRGYVKHIIDSVLNSDDELKTVLEPIPATLRPLYLYQSKMSLLTKIANTRLGSELLLEQGLIFCLSNLKVYDYHPQLKYEMETTIENDNNDDDAEEILNYLPPVECRYFQLFEPALNISNAIITSLGTINKSAVRQIILFLISHTETVELMLRGASPNLKMVFLKQLYAVTTIIARTLPDESNEKLLDDDDNDRFVVQDNRAVMHKIKKFMLGLIPKFVQFDKKSTTNDDRRSLKTLERNFYKQSIVNNLLIYGRNIGKIGAQRTKIDVVFSPSIQATSITGGFRSDDFLLTNSNTTTVYQEISLGYVIQILITTVNYYHKEKAALNVLKVKLNEIPEMSSVDLKYFQRNKNETSLFNINLMRENAYELLNRKFNKMNKLIECCASIIENALYIIWIHLQFYMLKAIPKSKMLESKMSLDRNSTMEGTILCASEAMWKYNLEEISSLKHHLFSVLNDSFCRQLLDTTQGRSTLDRSFLEVLLRKIKRLVQFVPVK